jgi:ABC-type Zn uptake system ZnuABC Zn-binding protein ZnuA
MRIKQIVVIMTLLLTGASGCDRIQPGRKAVLTGSTMIESLVRDIAPDIEILNLVGPMQCPGNFDMKPGDAERAASARIFLIHPYQVYLAEKIKKINRDIAVETLEPGDLNTPQEYIDGLEKTESILLKYFPGRRAAFESRRKLAAEALREREAKESLFIKKNAAKRINVLCSVFQVDFAKYAGFDIAGVFDGPDSLNPARLKELVKKAKTAKVRFIISNLTGDNDTSADIINKQLKADKITLSCYPVEEGNGSWFFNDYNYNLSRIKAALGGK